jgi:hypothetical protein
MSYYVESNNAAFSIQLNTFASELPAYATTLGFSAGDLAETVADAAYMDWMVKVDNIVEGYAGEFAKFLHDTRFPPAGGASTLTPPAVPILPAAPATVPAPGIQLRFTTKAKKAKDNNACTDAIQQKLGIFTSASTAHDGEAPDLKVKLNAGYPSISFHKYTHQAANLYRDIGDGNGYAPAPYKTLLSSPFVDKSLPAVGVTAVYKYKMVFLEHGEESGDFSGDVSVTVVGR